MRAFVACNLDVESVRRLEDVAKTLRGSSLAPKARWVPLTKMHVTLKFLGDIDLGLGPAIEDAIAPLAASSAPLRVGFESISAFPSADEARVVVVLLSDATGDLARLAEAVETRAYELGFEREARPFRPHVTLARPAVPKDVAGWLTGVRLPGELARVTELVLYRSDLGSPQNEYAALARLALKG
jgi:RNA 2',3'-cyclic 3'-phosphodiesterase